MKRFWNKVEKTESCWLWKASLRQAGYGAFKYLGKVYDAHRFVWMLVYHKMPTQWILHKCNNRRCVNPEHLYDGSAKDNYWDMRKSGSAYIPKSKYSLEEKIKRRREKGRIYWHQKGKYLRDARNASIAKMVTTA